MIFSNFLLAVGLILSRPLAFIERSDTLSGAVITSNRTITVSRVDTVKSTITTSSDGIADILQRVQGLQINDYGGPAGLKTISIRGMGNTHTSILIDGVPVGNIQSGQVDLGMLDMNSIGTICVDYVNSEINFISSKPTFRSNRKFGGDVSFAGGSFGTYIPSLCLNYKVSDNISIKASGNGYLTKGNYEYDNGQRRQNNDLKQFRGGLDIFGELKDFAGDWHAKAYYNDACRGCPGSLSWSSTDRQIDRNGFLQGSYRQHVNDLYTISVNAKASYDLMQYIGNDYENIYRQSEAQLNSTHNVTINRWLSFVAEEHIQFDNLKSDIYNASRLGAEARISGFINTLKFKAQANLTYLGTFDKGGVTYNCITPLVAFRYIAADWIELTASGRRSYRVPTFNDLYYSGIGNTGLLPEDAWKAEAGFVAKKSFMHNWRISANFNAFYNNLTNKIICTPTDDPFVWIMSNIDKANVGGVDIQSAINYSSSVWAASFNASYYLQGGTAIPYEPKHKVSLSADTGYLGWGLSAIWNWRSTTVDSYDSIMDSWNTLDVTVYKKWKSLTFKIAGHNLCNTRYEVVSGYPMPGTSIIGAVEIRL